MKRLNRFISLAAALAVMLTAVSFPAGAVTLPLKGDVDGSGAVAVADILMIKNIIMSGDCSLRVKRIADVDGNGAVNVSDILQLKNYIMDGYAGEVLPAAEIADGKTYYIENVNSGMVMTQGGEGYMHISACTGTLAQQWTAVKHGDYYMIVSPFNGKAWTIRDAMFAFLAAGEYDGTAEPNDDQLFSFVPDDNGGYRIRPKSRGGTIEIPFDSTDEDNMVFLWGDDNSASENWRLSEAVPARDDEHLDSDFADLVFDSFCDTFYRSNSSVGYIVNSNHFWDLAEMMEMFIDAYERSGSSRHLQMINKSYESFITSFGEDWTWNEFNDDIMWMVLFCCRAYNATGDVKYKEQAIYHFDKVYDRAISASLGGGLYWKNGNTVTKNACINCPAAIAATYLYEFTKDNSYLEKAEKLLGWVTDTLFDSESGAVKDNIHYNEDREAVIDETVYTYNQGTFIGAATRLYEITGNKKYSDNAKAAADYTVHTMYRDDVINNEGGNNDYDDSYGFKGIFFRWLGYYMDSQNITEYDEWIGLNLYYGWNNRNTKDLVSTRWDGKSIEKLSKPFSYYNFVVLAQIAPYERLRELNK